MIFPEQKILQTKTPDQIPQNRSGNFIRILWITVNKWTFTLQTRCFVRAYYYMFGEIVRFPEIVTVVSGRLMGCRPTRPMSTYLIPNCVLPQGLIHGPSISSRRVPGRSHSYQLAASSAAAKPLCVFVTTWGPTYELSSLTLRSDMRLVVLRIL